MSTNGKTILVVDDEKDILDFLVTLFEDHGYNILVAENGSEAVNMTRDHKPDLITLDITMPEQSGVKAYKQLRQDDATKTIPIIIVTGYEDPYFEKFISTRRQVPPPEAFFEKPVKQVDLLAKVKELIG